MPWICASVVGFSGTMFALLFLLPIYLQVARHSTALDAGLQLLPLTAGIVAAFQPWLRKGVEVASPKL